MLKEITLKMAGAMTPIEQSIMAAPANVAQLDQFALGFNDMSKPIIADDEWNWISFASVKDDEFLGRIRFGLKPFPRIVDSVMILSYTAFAEKSTEELRQLFVKDVLRAFDHMLMERGYEKIAWFSILDGEHSHECPYQSLAQQAGKIVGTLRRHYAGRSGRIYDAEEYEVYRERWQEIRGRLHL